MLRFKTLLLVLSLSLPLASCATTTPERPYQRPSQPSPQKGGTHQATEKKEFPLGRSADEERAIQQIKASYSQKAYPQALLQISHFERKFLSSPYLPYAFNYQGLIYFIQKQPQQAIQSFTKALNAGADSQYRSQILYNLSTSYFEANQTDEAQKSVAKINPDQLDPVTRLKYHWFKVRIYTSLNKPKAVVTEALVAGDWLVTQNAISSSDEKIKGSIEQALEENLKAITDIDETRTFYEDHRQSAFADHLLFKLGRDAYRFEKKEAAEQYLKALITDHPSSTHFNDATEYLRSLQNPISVESRKVGVLLPMTGRFAKVGLQSLRGIELAFRVFNAKDVESKMTLVIEDSGETPEQALTALNKLCLEEHVIAVIGPLMSKGIDQVTERAQELGIPLISLARQEGKLGDYVFQAAVADKLQAYEIAKVAIEKMGMSRFAILYPDERFGRESLVWFWDAVESLGGEIVGAEAYAPEQTDFREPVDRLVGLAFPESRERELKELEQLRIENKIKVRSRKTEQYYLLKPIVDFDAVFIPDEARRISQILPTFRYRDVEHVRFLGISAWNSKTLIDRAGEDAEGSLFVDAFFKDSASAASRGFLSRFQSTFGEKETPSSIEALAFDAASIVERALMTGNDISGRAQLAERLRQLKDFPGATGNLSYQDGVFKRNLKVLTIQKNEITEVD